MSIKRKRRLLYKLLISSVLILIIYSANKIMDEEVDNNNGITVKTDKLKYTQSEIIKITVKNNSKADIYSHIGSGTPVLAIQYIHRKLKSGKWEKLFAQCQYPNCMIDSDAPQAVKPGQSKTMEWNPLIFIDGTSKSIRLIKGKYQILVLYEGSDMKEWKAICTNVFTII